MLQRTWIMSTCICIVMPSNYLYLKSIILPMPWWVNMQVVLVRHNVLSLIPLTLISQNSSIYNRMVRIVISKLHPLNLPTWFKMPHICAKSILSWRWRDKFIWIIFNCLFHFKDWVIYSWKYLANIFTHR